MQQRYLFFIAFLLLLAFTNPEPSSFRLSALAKTTGKFYDFFLASLLIYKPVYSASNRPRYYLGIFGKWIPLDFSLFSSLFCRCKSGICVLGECICFLGWKGKSCGIKRSDFKSIWRFAAQPLLFYLSDMFPSSLSKGVIFEYEFKDCILGIPLHSISSSPLLSLLVPYLPESLINMGNKLSFLDIYLGLSIMCFLWCKGIQFGLLRRVTYFDLSWYNVQERGMLFTIFFAPFWHPYTIPFLNHIYSFSSLAPIGIGYLGHDYFCAYLFLLTVACSLASILCAARTGRRMTFYNGLSNVITGLQFLYFFFQIDKKTAFRSQIIPHFIYLFFVSGGALDMGGIFCSAFVSFLVHLHVMHP